jgi:hypothetical protein
MNTSKRSDIYSRQWDVGSFTDPTKKPYKVSERRDGGWECSCPAWTRHTPRTDCKHIRSVQKAILAMPAAPVFAQPTPPPTMRPSDVAFDGYTIRRALEDTLAGTDTDSRCEPIRSRRDI